MKTSIGWNRRLAGCLIVLLKRRQTVTTRTNSLMFLLAVGCACGGSAGYADTAVRIPSKDAFIAQPNPTTNYGSYPLLQVSGQDLAGGTSIYSVLDFDLTYIPRDAVIESVALELTLYGGGQNGIKLYWFSSSDNWAESSVTWQYMTRMRDYDDGLIETVVGSPSRGSVWRWSNDMLRTVVANRINDPESYAHVRGFMLVGTVVQQGAVFYAKEESTIAYRPRLIINYSVPEPSITVEVPSGGERWCVGETHQFGWSTENIPDNEPELRADLYKGGQLFDVIDEDLWNDGVANWSIPSDTPPGSDYRIRISYLADSSVFDFSDYFTICSTSECIPTLSPSSRDVPASGGSYSVDVTIWSGCSWTASPNVSWITITSSSSGSGNGTISYTVASNPNETPRQGGITVTANDGNATHAVNQEGTQPCTGCVRVRIRPRAARLEGAMWRIDGGPWRPAGLLCGVSPGTHLIEFKPVSGRVTPSPRQINVDCDTTQTVIVRYRRQ